ncbi:cytochrome c3 family protein [Haliangium sp.]|uniref:cytochrome c3 family protein n=1 Tax=Haliangium sp. TaxID=2663208 RepID=UPI003D12E73C
MSTDSPRVRRLERVAVVGLIAAALAGGVGLYLILRVNQASQPPAPRLEVSARFRDIRQSPGHRDHIEGHGVACADCHDLDPDGLGFTALGADLCQRCHPDQRVAVHTSLLAESSTDCLDCHRFSEDRSIRPDHCLRCHDQAQGYVEAIVQHREESCLDCHRVHQEPALVPRPCVDCHERTDTRHVPGLAGALLCLDCHDSHDTHNQADQRCARCHRDGPAAIPATALFPGHDACVGCHAPHDFSRRGARGACERCHQDHPALAADRVDEHRACTSCHDPHDAGAEAARARCLACHAKIESDHVHTGEPGRGLAAASVQTLRRVLDRLTGTEPGAPSTGPASGPATASPAPASTDPGRACLACHPAHPVVVGAHVRDCAECHRAPGSSFHAPTVTCTACHRPHTFTVRGLALCAGCHRRQHELTAANEGHATCTDCHRRAAHEPSATPAACRDCHAEQTQTAPAGHSACADCHDTHSGGLIKTCAGCHPDQHQRGHGRVRARDLRVRGPESCAACHRPHGPDGVAAPPTCSSCHPASKLRGLHRDPNHDACRDCHRAHEPAPPAERAACGRCHGPLSEHEPGTEVCIGCHPFTD